MTTPPDPGERRRLERPPAARYTAPRRGDDAGEPPRPRRPGVALAAAQLIGLVGAVAIVLLGNVLEVDLGLIAVAGLIGWLVGGAVSGVGPTLTRPARRVVAIGMAVESVVLGQAGLWMVSLAQGGVLDPLTYLGQVFGVAIPLQIVAAIGAAWLACR